jgi:hypothetical protein
MRPWFLVTERIVLDAGSNSLFRTTLATDDISAEQSKFRAKTQATEYNQSEPQWFAPRPYQTTDSISFKRIRLLKKREELSLMSDGGTLASCHAPREPQAHRLQRPLVLVKAALVTAARSGAPHA